MCKHVISDGALTRQMPPNCHRYRSLHRVEYISHSTFTANMIIGCKDLFIREKHRKNTNRKISWFTKTSLPNEPFFSQKKWLSRQQSDFHWNLLEKEGGLSFRVRRKVRLIDFLWKWGGDGARSRSLRSLLRQCHPWGEPRHYCSHVPKDFWQMWIRAKK